MIGEPQALTRQYIIAEYRGEEYHSIQLNVTHESVAFDYVTP